MGKASEQHRLKCRDGTDETDDLQRYSSMSGGSSGESAVDTLLAKVRSHLKNQLLKQQLIFFY